MNYHTFKENDMLNGDGLRSVLWVSGCEAHCKNCFNPETWDFSSGEQFTADVMEQFIESARPDWISGITIVGGEPLHDNNIHEVKNIITEFKKRFPNKTVWLYTGYSWDEINKKSKTNEDAARKMTVHSLVDILVDGRYIDELKDESAKWKGSTNQRVIDVKESVKTGKVVLHS